MKIKDIGAQFKKLGRILSVPAIGGILVLDMKASTMPQKQEVVTNSTQYTADLLHMAAQNPTAAAAVAAVFVAPLVVAAAYPRAKRLAQRLHTAER